MFGEGLCPCEPMWYKRPIPHHTLEWDCVGSFPEVQTLQLCVLVTSWGDFANNPSAVAKFPETKDHDSFHRRDATASRTDQNIHVHLVHCQLEKAYKGNGFRTFRTFYNLAMALTDWKSMHLPQNKKKITPNHEIWENSNWVTSLSISKAVPYRLLLQRAD